jgi:hypothetical protein
MLACCQTNETQLAANKDLIMEFVTATNNADPAGAFSAARGYGE